MNYKLRLGLCLFVFFMNWSFGLAVQGQADADKAKSVAPAITERQDKLQPKQVIEKPEYDFGDVQLGTSAKHTFILKNPTSTLMKIREIAKSCGCTVPKVSRREIKPGQSTEIEVAINTDSFRGRKESTIHVIFDQPTDFEVQLKVTVTIRNLLVEPEPIVFRGAKINVPSKQIIKVTRHGSPFWKITKVSSGSNELSGKIVKRTIRGSVVSYDIECETTETKSGLRSDRIIVHSNDTGELEYAIPVHIEVEDEISASVDSIEFDQNSEGASKRFLIKTTQPSEIVSLEVSPAGMLAKAAPGRKKIHFVDVVRETKEDFKGELRVKTDVSESTITIPVEAKKVLKIELEH